MNTEERIDTSIDIRRLGGEGILTHDDLADFAASEVRVLRLLLDGRWHTAEEIRAAANGSEGLRRLRALRPLVKRHGLQIAKVRRPGSRTFHYALRRAA